MFESCVAKFRIKIFIGFTMFEKNDRYLLMARIFSIVLFICCAISVVASGIYLAVVVNWAYVFAIPFGLLLVWIAWVFVRTVLGFFCDTKLIRNKLYKESNVYLESYYRGKIKNAKIRPQSQNQSKSVQPTIKQNAEEKIVEKQQEDISIIHKTIEDEEKTWKNWWLTRFLIIGGIILVAVAVTLIVVLV